MTGHVIVQTQTPTFLTTLQATLDILDDISGRIDENTYLTLANNLQQLHNIHTSNPTSNPTSNTTSNSTSNSTSYANNARTDYIRTRTENYVSDISYASIRYFNISNDNTTNNNNNINIINTNINNNEYRNIQALNEETNRMNYSTRTRLILYGNAFNTLNNDAN